MFSLIERREKANQRKKKKEKEIMAGLLSLLCSPLCRQEILKNISTVCGTFYKNTLLTASNGQISK